jgi:hypothetical protein
VTDDPRPTNWTPDQLIAAADSLGTICGNVVRAGDDVDWEAHSDLHEAVVTVMVETLLCTQDLPPSCPKCGSGDLAIFSNSATCLRACKWTGTGVEAETAGRTFYRATLADPEIHVGTVKVLEPEGMAAVDRIKERAAAKLEALANRVKVTHYLKVLRDKEDPLSAYIANEMVKHDDGEEA